MTCNTTSTEKILLVLIADDNDSIRLRVRTILSGQSRWEICGEAVNGREAVEKFKELRPDIVLLDVNMPVMGGIEAAHEIRRIAPSIKIILLTLHDFSPLHSAARLTGADAVVVKQDAGTSLMGTMDRLFTSGR